jgi:hypothetical protein
MVRTLFIAGNGRSGSTILHNILGQIDGFAAVGELRYIWGRAAIDNQLCGCGERFRDCPFWDKVMTHAFGGLDLAYARRMYDAIESFRLRNLPLMAAPVTHRRELTRLAEYLEGLARLYAGIQHVSGSRIIVDSSKNPSYGYLLRYVHGVEPYYLHLVRDVPAVAYSWGKHQDFEPGVPMARKSAAASALQWLARNTAAELFLRRSASPWLQMRYEDFVSHPRNHVRSMLEWLGEPSDSLPFTSSHEANVDRRNHSVFGNRARFRVGPVIISADEQWRTQLSTRDRRTVTALTWPLRAYHGYTGPTRLVSRPATAAATRGD